MIRDTTREVLAQRFVIDLAVMTAHGAHHSRLAPFRRIGSQRVSPFMLPLMT
jgi:hypothetical protein